MVFAILKPLVNKGRQALLSTLTVTAALATMTVASTSYAQVQVAEQSQSSVMDMWQVRDALASSLAHAGLLEANHEDALHSHDHAAGVGGDVEDEISVLASNDALADKINELSERVQQREDRLAELSESITQQKKASDARHLLALMPVANAKVTSNYGYRRIFGKSQFHKGIDLAAAYGSPVYATGDGVVTYAGWVRGYGRFVKIQHADGYETRYAHNSALHVSVGDTVSQNQHISDIGCSGRCTGPHLHYEVRKDGKPTNPDIFLAMAPPR